MFSNTINGGLLDNMQNPYRGNEPCLPNEKPSEQDEIDFGLFDEWLHYPDDSQPPSDVEAGNIQNFYQDGVSYLPYGAPCELESSDLNGSEMPREFLPLNGEANNNDYSQQLLVTPDVEIEQTEVSSIHLKNWPDPIGMVNGYLIYPTLQPWGSSDRFRYDEVGQLMSDVVFDKETMHEYLYNHPLGKKLIIWVQRHPSQAQSIYKTNYGGSCRYKECRPGKKPSRSIQVGHYRLAFDELTPRHPRHKADSYLYAAFFHVSCFEKMFDLADICREFDVRCEDRALVNGPVGDQTFVKNRMLLEERRIPYATAEWIKNTKMNPSWKTSCNEDSLNFLLFKKKWELRPHRRKCTDVPGMEDVGDISHLAKPRPVNPNPVWGGKRVKGLTVAQLRSIEGWESDRRHGQIEDGLKRKRTETHDDDEYLPPVKQSQSQKGRRTKKDYIYDSIVVDSSRAPSPVRFSKPGRGRDERRPRPSRKSASPTKATVEPVFKVEPLPVPGPVQQTPKYPPELNLESGTYPSLGSMIETAHGWYVREPSTGAMVQLLNVVTPSTTVPPTPFLTQTFASDLYPYQFNSPSPDTYNSGWVPSHINTQQDSMAAQKSGLSTSIEIDPLLLIPQPIVPVASTPSTPLEALQEQGNDQDRDQDQVSTQLSISPLQMDDFLFAGEPEPMQPSFCENENLDALQFSQPFDVQAPLGDSEPDFFEDLPNPDMYPLFCD